jgi:2-polyprenyl-3-methyl-5-hydroxy-6-metoxy-1,4-benzoquinol methylase
MVHHNLEDHLFGATGRWGIRQCTKDRCRLMWLDPMPLPAEIHKFYKNYYTHKADENQTRVQQLHPVPRELHPMRESSRTRLVKQALAFIFAWRKSAFLSGLCHLEDMVPGKLLEIGCGNGRFLREAYEAGWQATGIDFDEHAVSAARSISGVKASVGDLHSMNFGNAVFDAVVMNNVIEHVPNPAEVVAECSRVLRPGGRLVMITPNSWALGYRLFAGDWRSLEIPRHLHIFSPANLKTIARMANFRKVSAFSSAGGGTGLEVILESENILQKRLRRPAEPRMKSARKLILREKMLVLLSREVGEFAVLVAHK